MKHIGRIVSALILVSILVWVVSATSHWYWVVLEFGVFCVVVFILLAAWTPEEGENN